MRKPVVSGHLTGYDYDPVTKTLHVTFKNGSTYRYDNVPADVLNNADAKQTPGTLFVRNVRNKYPGKKVKG